MLLIIATIAVMFTGVYFIYQDNIYKNNLSSTLVVSIFSSSATSIPTPTSSSSSVTSTLSDASISSMSITTSNSTAASVEPVKTLTASLVLTHNQQSDCWYIIDNNVYNITAYFGKHPGGNSVMAPYCGKDATNAFATMGKSRGKSHSSYAKQLLASYKIGSIGDLIN
jgi:cytochrome b involved in lipid metabolism